MPNKFHARRTTWNGRTYDSKLEASVAQALDLARHADPPLVAEVWTQHPFKLPGGIWYLADFVVWLPDESSLVIEVKGFRTAVWRLKERLFHESNPGERLVVVKSPAEAIAAVQDAAKGKG